MNKRARIALWSFLVFALIVLISFMYFVFAEHTITPVTGTSFNVNEDVQVTYNISVNVTGAETANVTQVNITLLDSSFLFTTGTQGTSALGTFTNTTSVLSWTNSTFYLINGTSAGEIKYFWFNATASTPGDYNITVAVLNSTGPYYYNISVHVNDTTSPDVNLTYPLNITYNINVSALNYTLSAANDCWYSTNNGATNTSVACGTNLTGLTSTEGSNTWLVGANDSSNNKNMSRITFFKDTITPSINLTYPLNITYNTNVSALNYTLSDANLNDCWYSTNNGATNTSVACGTNLTGLTSTEGSNTWLVGANDSSNNKNMSRITFFKDTITPVITLISPTNGNTTTNPLSISFIFNVSDATLTNCSLILNGKTANFNSSVNKTGGNTIFVNSTYSMSNSWNVTCADSTNNKANSTTYTFSPIAFVFNGTAKDEDGNALNNSVINVTIRNQQFTTLAYVSGTSNASGWFNFSIPSNTSLMYQSSIIHRNSTTDAIDFISKTLPSFPDTMMTILAGTNFYLTPAGTINITAINSTSDSILFQYQIKDIKLGYPVAEEHSTYANEVVVFVPRNRNYSIMIYPNQSMPVSFNWNNFASTISYNLTNISSYNVITHTLHKQFNTSMTMARVTGYANVSGVSYANFTVIPYLLEPGNMIHSEYGDMPYNLSHSNNGQTDFFNLTDGWFNISLPATAESSTIVLFATAINGSNYYGGFKNISLSYGTATNKTDISMYPLMGTAGNITMDRIDGGGQNIEIPTKKQTFNLVNEANSTLTQTQAHIETTVDYSSYGSLEFTWMSDIQQSQGNASFTIPLLNATGIKEMNVFASGGPSGSNSQYAPKRVSTMSAAQIITNNNITMRTFNPGAIDGSLTSSQITISLYISNSSCDVPIPPVSCALASSTTMATFNPMQAVMGGGKISFRMGYSGIFVHYVNVDMLASGPPDALFENDPGISESSSTFQNIVKFGSQGPTIYDYVLVSIPYLETAGSGLNDSTSVSISVPLLYDDNWNIIWNVSTNGTNAAALANNYSHYSTYQSAWGNLTASKICTTSSINSTSQINETSPCYIDKDNNKIWVRLPHFSGTGPSVSGSVLATGTTTPGSGSGTGVGANKTKSQSWTKITPGAATIWKLVDKDLGIKQISITVNNPAQNVQITITKYDGLPANVTKAKSGKVYKYLKIEEKNLGKNLSKAVITMQVEKSWIKNNNLTKEKIALFKFNNSEWKEIKTDYKEEDITNYYYDAELTSFSYFAIAEKVVTAAPVTCTPSWTCGEWSECAEGTKTRTCTDSNNCGVITGKPVESQTCEGKTPIPPLTWAIIIGAIIAGIVIILILVIYGKKKY